MAEKRSNKLTTTIRLDPLQREILEAIADREMRTLSNQISVLLHSSIKCYLTEEKLAYVPKTKSLQEVEEGFPYNDFYEPTPPE